MRPRTVHVQEMSQMEVNDTGSTVPTEEYPREDQMISNRQRQLAEIFRPIFIAMKLTGQFFGETALTKCRGRSKLHISHFFSALIVLGQWLNVVLGLTSSLYVGFSSMSKFFFLLVSTIWYVQCAGNTIVCLFVLPLMNRRPSRFAQFLSSFVTTAPELDGMKGKTVRSLAIACLAAVINSTVLAIFNISFEGVISIHPPWDQHTGLRLTVRVIEMVWGLLNSFAWTLPPVIFCTTCMLPEQMFDSFQNKMSKESIHSFSIAYLRQEHLKLCEMVELANAVFSPLLFVIISLDVPLICINTYQTLKLSSGAETIRILAYVYWGFIICALLVVIFIFGNRVNRKVSPSRHFEAYYSIDPRSYDRKKKKDKI